MATLTAAAVSLSGALNPRAAPRSSLPAHHYQCSRIARRAALPILTADDADAPTQPEKPSLRSSFGLAPRAVPSSRTLRPPSSRKRAGPPVCPLSGKKLPYSMAAVISHLGSREHLAAVGGPCACGSCAPVTRFDELFRPLFFHNMNLDQPRGSAHRLAQAQAELRAQADSLRGVRRRASLLLRCPTQRLTHRAAGYDIDGLTAALARSFPADGARKAARRLPPKHEWLVEEDRYYVGWDSEVSGGPASFSVSLAEAPPNAAVHRRLRADELPAPLELPPLPIELEERAPIARALAWPYVPGVTLALAAAQRRGESLEGVDAVVGTSLLQALSGDRLGKYAKSSFLVQRVGGAVCFQHLPIRAANILNQPGHQLEEICSPRRKGSVAHYSVGRLKIDDLTVLCVSEIDASENGAPVELKSFAAGSHSRPFVRREGAQNTMQATVSGSRKVLLFTLTPNRTVATATRSLRTSTLRRIHKDAWGYFGQRVRYLLPQVLSHPLVQSAVDQPVHMLLDNAKMPYFVPAPAGCSVVAPDFYGEAYDFEGKGVAVEPDLS